MSELVLSSLGGGGLLWDLEASAVLSVLRGLMILHVIWVLSKAPEDGEHDPFLNGLVIGN